MTHPAESATFPSLHEAQAQDPSLIPTSFAVQDGAALWLSRRGEKKHLVVALTAHDRRLARLDGERLGTWDGLEAKLCPRTSANAGVLRDLLAHLSPVPLGLTTSAGFGDRLGVATPQGVIDDATWGAFEAGWRGALGADADHQKMTRDLDACAAAGFTLFTIDPGEFVDDAAHNAPPSDLEARVDALPWDDLETTSADFERYVGKTLDSATAPYPRARGGAPRRRQVRARGRPRRKDVPPPGGQGAPL